MQRFEKLLRPDINFDVVYRVIRVGGRNACIYFIDGFTKDDTLLRILQSFGSIKPEAMPDTAHEFSKLYLPYGEIGLETEEDILVTQLLSGVPCMLIDGYEQGFSRDCRTYPARVVSEPEKDKVLR